MCVYDVEPAVVVCAGDALGAQLWRETADALGARVAQALPLDAAALAEQAPADAVLVDVRDDAGAPLDRLLEALEHAAAAGRHPSIVAIPPALIDLAAARLAHADVAILCDPTPLERSAALSLALAARPEPLLREVGDESPQQLRRLSEEVGRIARALAALSAGDTPAAPLASAPAPGEAVDLPPVGIVRTMIRTRRLRDQYFDAELFADPAWDMLLDLLLAHIEERPVAVSSLCIASAVPATTALRWIKRLTDAGIFLRHSDPRDGRRVFIDLADGALRALSAYFQTVGRMGVRFG